MIEESGQKIHELMKVTHIFIVQQTNVHLVNNVIP